MPDIRDPFFQAENAGKLRALLLGQTDNLPLDQVSGGSTGSGGNGSSTAAKPAPEITDFVAEEGGILAVAYGEHLVAGNLIVHQYSAGPPPDSIFAIALGDGEWDSAVNVWYAGEPLSESPDGNTPGFRFHRGTISTGISDPMQGVDPFLPAGLAYSGTANVVIKLPDFLAVEDRPDKFRGRFKCKRVWDYECDGSQASFGYFTNPANVALDGVRRYYEKKYFTNLSLAYEKFRARINWPAWCEWWNFNATNITWNDGTNPTRQIARFDCHIAFTDDLNLADFLDQVCATCGAFWQDDGELLTFLPPLRLDGTDYPPVHHFNESNIVSGSFNISPMDIRTRPNYFIAKFRNLDDPFLTETSVEVRREELIKKVGRNLSERRFANMTISQAQRLLERQARIEADNPYICTLRAFGDSIHVLPGDYVAVTHSIPNWNFQRCLVLDVSVASAEKSPDEVDFTLQKIDQTLYTDTAHGPIQVGLAPFLPSNLSGLTLWLEASSINQADGTVVSAWNDKSSSAFNFSQGTGANQPIYKTNNGKPFVLFDGSNDFMRRASLPILNLVGARNFSLFLAINDPVQHNGRLYFHADFGAYRFAGASWGDGNLYADMGNGGGQGLVFGTKPPYYHQTGHVFEVTRDDSTGRIAVDGTVVVEDTSVPDNIPSQTQNFDIGAGTDGNFSGRIYGMVVFNRTLTTSESSQMRTYMAGLLDLTTEFNPSSVANLTFWLEAGNIPQADNTAVSAWNDRSSNAFHLSQGTGANQPIFKLNAGKPYVQFDGSNDSLTRASVPILNLIGATNCTIFVAMLDTGNQNSTLFSHTDGASYRVLAHAGWGDNNIYVDMGNATNNRIAVAEPGNWQTNPHVFEIVRDGTTVELLLDGATLVTDTSVPDSVGAQTQAFDLGTGVGSFFKGRIYGMAIYSRTLNATERLAVRNYMAGLI